MKMDKQISQELVTFIKQSPTAFHAVANMQNILIEHGYEELLEGQTWQIKKGGHYFVTRNNSSIIAFNLGENLDNYSFNVAASAYLDFGVWALVGQTLVNGLLIVVLYAYFCRWKPLWIFSLKSFRLLFAFGSKLVLANILNTLYKNLYAIVIGKKFSSVDLGFYTRAEQFAQFPSYNLSAIISRVTYPILSLVQNDNDRLSALYRKYVRLSSAFIFPLMILLIVIAQPLVLLLLTEKWIGVVVLLQILCLDWMFDHLSSINLNLLYVKGRSDLALRLEVIKKVLATGILLLSIPWGIVGMCWGRVMYSLIAVYLNTYYTESLIKLSLIRQMRDILPSFFLALIMGGGTWYMILLLEGEIVQIVVGSVIALLLYGTLLYCFSRSLFDEIWAVILKIKR